MGGDCFMGPQIQTWQDEWDPWFDTATGGDASIEELWTTDNIAVPRNWLPSRNETQGRCYINFLEEKSWYIFEESGTTQPDLSFTPADSPTLTQVEGCDGPNNCYPTSFKTILTILLLAHMVGHHCLCSTSFTVPW